MGHRGYSEVYLLSNTVFKNYNNIIITHFVDWIMRTCKMLALYLNSYYTSE